MARKVTQLTSFGNGNNMCSRFSDAEKYLVSIRVTYSWGEGGGVCHRFVTPVLSRGTF